MKHRPKSPPPPARAGLFGEAENPAPRRGEPGDLYTAEIDGASRGNPGPASYAVILRKPDGSVAHQISKYLGHHTNNVAEYHALIAALDYAARHGLRVLRVRSDSELLVRQMNGLYRVKDTKLRPLHERAKKLAQGIPHFSIQHVRRELNQAADRLANQALDRLDGPRSAASDPPRVKPRSRRIGTKLEAGRVRARYRDGALHPSAPLDLAEGEEVEITIHR